MWRADGKELFYTAPNGNIMAVPLAVSLNGEKLEPGKPVSLFATRLSGSPADRDFAVTPDGLRFLIVVPVETTPSPIMVLLNWAKRS